MCISNKLSDIVNDYNNVYLITTKMKPVDVKWSTYIDSGLGNNDEDANCKVGDQLIIWRYRNIFGERYAPNWFEDVFVIKKVKILVPWTYLVEDLEEEKM